MVGEKYNLHIFLQRILFVQRGSFGSPEGFWTQLRLAFTNLAQVLLRDEKSFQGLRSPSEMMEGHMPLASVIILLSEECWRCGHTFPDPASGPVAAGLVG